MVDVKAQLVKLVELHKLDAQIYARRRVVEEHPRRVEVLRKTLQGVRANLTMLEERLKQLQMERKEKEMDLSGKEENVRKYQGQQMQVKSNKEYSALQTEIDGLKADNSMLEEEILHLFDEIDRAAARVAEERQRFAQEEKRVQGEELVLGEERKTAEAELTQLNEKRKQMVPSLDPLVLKNYERVLANRAGSALVPIQGDACGGCHTHLPPQVINELKRSREIIACERCSRILYCEE
ncbi:MAG: hypothetical protein HYY14_00470 [Candidatus Omnitrophica bacterium]|nr:hypothetical protein [Candidatus Omnitrophota bacterium]